MYPLRSRVTKKRTGIEATGNSGIVPLFSFFKLLI
ncbi:hypothetical protein B4U80_07408 [Leptotrombidium deliense]|uniref:Uncharacterized protein n=1 Tax=Leptotrombidium deliense TaxID=299467 RepID=A0A443S6T4_9ACAR|nr:hypothetical protein B4U80_07408 [Leptotrombidium deliense]